MVRKNRKDAQNRNYPSFQWKIKDGKNGKNVYTSYTFFPSHFPLFKNFGMYNSEVLSALRGRFRR